MASHWVVKIVKVIAYVAGFGFVGVFIGGFTGLFVAEKGFGFLQSKPRSSLGRYCYPVDALRKYWYDSKLHADMVIELNGQRIGKIDTAREMTFNFAELIAHAAKTRELSNNTLIGSGTVSSSTSLDGFGCLMERNAVLDKPEIYMKSGDRIKMYIPAKNPIPKNRRRQWNIIFLI